jgi:hypothetical protein
LCIYIPSITGKKYQIVYQNKKVLKWQIIKQLSHGDMWRIDLWIELCESSPTRNCFLFSRSHGFWWGPCCSSFVFSVLCCAFVFVYLRPVSCVPNSASVSKLYIPDCPFGILQRYFTISIVYDILCIASDRTESYRLNKI